MPGEVKQREKTTFRICIHINLRTHINALAYTVMQSGLKRYIKSISISCTNRVFGLVFYYNSIIIGRIQRQLSRFFWYTCFIYSENVFFRSCLSSYNSNHKRLSKHGTWSTENTCSCLKKQFNVNGMNVNDSICTYTVESIFHSSLTLLTFLRNDFVCIVSFSFSHFFWFVNYDFIVGLRTGPYILYALAILLWLYSK